MPNELEELIAEAREVLEAWRKRRTAYRSGRLELIGHEPSPFKRKRKVKKSGENGSALKYTPFKSNFRWKRS
jgi:hypothetical protein